jgi:hypothetical protein
VAHGTAREGILGTAGTRHRGRNPSVGRLAAQRFQGPARFDQVDGGSPLLYDAAARLPRPPQERPGSAGAKHLTPAMIIGFRGGDFSTSPKTALSILASGFGRFYTHAVEGIDYEYRAGMRAEIDDMVAFQTRTNHASADVTIEDQWFAAMDGQEIDLPGSAHSRLHIEGVHWAANDLWIQLAPLASGEHGIVLHCWDHQSPYAVLSHVRTVLKYRGWLRKIDATDARH